MSNVYSTPAEDSPERDQVGRNPATHTDMSAGRSKSYAPNPYWSRSNPEPPTSPVPPMPAVESPKTEPGPTAVEMSPLSSIAVAPEFAAELSVTVDSTLPVSMDTDTTPPEPIPDSEMEARLRLAWQATVEPIQAQLEQVTKQLAQPQPLIILPDELTEQVSQHITDWLPQLPDLLRPTLEQLLNKAVPRIVRVEQPGRSVLRLVRVLTVCSVVLGLVLGGLLYQVFDLRRQLNQVTPGYWQHRYLQAQASVGRNRSFQQWLYRADTLYTGNTFTPTLLRLEDQMKSQVATPKKVRVSRHK